MIYFFVSRYHGVALALPLQAGSDVFWRTFLDRRNHQPSTVPLDYISYHWYGAGPGTAPGLWAPFEQADTLLAEAARIQAIVAELSPATKVNVDEIGSIGGCNDVMSSDRWYFNAIGAVYAYVYARLAALGVEIMAASQLLAYGDQSRVAFSGFPGGLDTFNFPCVTMLSWEDGTGTARFHTLKLLIDGLSGANTVKTLVATTFNATDQVFAQGFLVAPAGGGAAGAPPSRKVLLLVNKANTSCSVTVQGASGANTTWVDMQHGHGTLPYGSATLQSDGVNMGGYAVQLIYFS